MAGNQAQPDHLLPSTSAEDPEIRMQKLQDEVDLIKVSIKRLLIDIRERMNELENPFVHAMGESVRSGGGEELTKATVCGIPASGNLVIDRMGNGTMESSHEASSDLRDTPHSGTEIPEHVMGAIKAQALAKQTQKPEISRPSTEKLRLTKVHHLFEWTSRMVKKYGHDRLDLMLQSYRAMGYLTRESADQVKEISRLMPSGLGESHDISPDEFIEELYALNRILDPSDTSLDRDMIEVLMEQRTIVPAHDKKLPAEKGHQDTWARIPDGI